MNKIQLEELYSQMFGHVNQILKNQLLTIVYILQIENS